MSKQPWLRKSLFSAVIYVLVFGTIELGFRVSGAGSSTQLLLEHSSEGEAYLKPNGGYTNQFFFRPPTVPPSASTELFPADNPKDRYRIYVIGESTSRGFPYSKTEAFPFQLQEILKLAHPELPAEVINLSIDATNSHIGVQVAKELASHPPDLVIVYYGHNEFIGMGGAGQFNSLPFQMNRVFSRSRAYQALKGALAGEGDSRSLLSRMTSKAGVPYTSDVFAATMADFRRNYTSILQTFDRMGVPTVACGVVSNIGDLPPLARDGRPTEQAIEEARELGRKGPSPQLDSLVGDDPHLNFVAGRSLVDSDQAAAAKKYMLRARDLDPLRFRAASDVNPIIEESCDAQKNCSFVDFATQFADHSPHGIVGNNLLLEHVHPTREGHALMARSLARLMTEHLDEAAPQSLPKPLEFATLIESITSARTMLNTFENFPFDGAGFFNPAATDDLYQGMTRPDSTRTLRQGVEQETYALINQWIDTKPTPGRSLLHTKLAIWFVQQNREPEAYRELVIAAMQDPTNCHALSNMAVVHFRLSKNAERALGMLETAVQRCPEHKNALINQWVLLDGHGKRAEAQRVAQKLQALGVELSADQALKLDDPQFGSPEAT